MKAEDHLYISIIDWIGHNGGGWAPNKAQSKVAMFVTGLTKVLFALTMSEWTAHNQPNE